MANLLQKSPTLVKIGDTIRYTLKDLNDTIVYSGKVVALCDYESAKAYADVIATHQAMLAADSTIDDVDTLRFLIVECYDGVRRPVGYQADGKNSWFTGNQLEIIEVGREFTIRLYNTSSSDAAMAIRILREQGFSCKIESK